MTIKRGDLKGKTYKDARGRTIRILGADMLWPDGSRLLVEREDGKQWGVLTDSLIEAVTIEECRKRVKEMMKATAPPINTATDNLCSNPYEIYEVTERRLPRK